jgi:hypothetical protein
MPSDDREFAFSSRVFPKASQIKALYTLLSGKTGGVYAAKGIS